ncbi:hypothetical protein BYT27DRAFT_7209373 [Phlegmacium glaucopus]|nr:hypothetical protein BYT27DRAFT_7209373 [Phlegmacium glaucopus]
MFYSSVRPLYQYLVMQFTREEEITPKRNYENPTYGFVSSDFRASAGKKIIGSGSFQSQDGHPSFKANIKTIQGNLFLLERYIFFVSRQPTLIEINDVYQVIFSRVGAGAGASTGRTFDLKRSRTQFTSINRDEHEITEAHMKDKKVRVKNDMDFKVSGSDSGFWIPERKRFRLFQC